MSGSPSGSSFFSSFTSSNDPERSSNLRSSSTALPNLRSRMGRGACPLRNPGSSAVWASFLYSSSTRSWTFAAGISTLILSLQGPISAISAFGSSFFFSSVAAAMSPPVWGGYSREAIVKLQLEDRITHRASRITGRLGVGFALHPDLDYLQLTRDIVERDADYFEVNPETMWRTRGGRLERNDYHSLFLRFFAA